MRGVGRNGLYQQTGIKFELRGLGLSAEKHIDIRGVTSRDTLASGKIAVPMENLGEVIEALQKIKDEYGDN